MPDRVLEFKLQPVKTYLFAFLVMTCLVASEFALAKSLVGQGPDRLTPVQREIERQRVRLNSSEAEERRDALMRLSSLHRPEASRTAAAALSDVVPSVRVAAAHAILSLPPDEAARLLLPLMGDKLEFVRREAAYALGKTRSRVTVTQLANLLLTDKEAGVRAAAAVALGEIGDEFVVYPGQSHNAAHISGRFGVGPIRDCLDFLVCHTD